MPESYKHYLENDSILVVFQHSQQQKLKFKNNERKSKTTIGGGGQNERLPIDEGDSSLFSENRNRFAFPKTKLSLKNMFSGHTF